MADHAQDQEAGPGEERSQLDGSSIKCHLVNARAQVRSVACCTLPCGHLQSSQERTGTASWCSCPLAGKMLRMAGRDFHCDTD